MEDTDTLDRTSELAKEKLANMEKAEKEQEDKSKEESKDASSDESSTKKEKIEGTTDENLKDAEKSMDKLIEKTEEKPEGESKTDNEIVESKEKEESKTPEEKLKDWQDKTQERIDGLIKESKDSKEQDKATIESLEQKIADMQGELESSGSIESEDVKLSKTAEESYAKMVEDDTDLPREQRREMSEEELEDYLLEDYSKA
jgi:hypothetical protein